ncbi:MAG: CPBP family intramembrane metalloprotease, partial [Bacteroidota bacterium]|nr:CPBP family intramembrane metalloprotease [Bacteroidota bacterium]
MNQKFIYKAFFRFLRHPNDQEGVDISIGRKLKVLLQLFLFDVVIVIILLAINYIIHTLHILEPTHHKLEDLFISTGYVWVFITAVIIAPIFEELIFRLPLIYRYNYIFRAIVYLLSVSGVVADDKLDKGVIAFRRKYFIWFFYLMAILFGFMHITNYSGYKELLFWMPLLTSSQLISGIILGYIRIKYGLIWSIYYHAFNNLVFITIAFCSIVPFKGYTTSNNAYSVSIQPDKQSIKESLNIYTCRVTPDTISFRDVKTDKAISILSEVTEKYVKSSSLMPIDIDFYMKRKQQNTDLSRKLLLQEIQRALKISITHRKKNVNIQEAFIGDPVRYNKGKLTCGDCQASTLRRTCRLIDVLYPEQ